MEDYLIYLIIAVIAVGSLIYSFFKKKSNLKKMDSGQDRERLKQAVARVLPEETDYQVVYAHREESTYGYRRTTTYYYYYALAFNDSRLWVIPLQFQKTEIQTGRPFLITAEDLNVLNVTPTMKKEELWQIFATFQYKSSEAGGPPNLYVDAINTNTDRFHHFNMNQRAECQKLNDLLTAMSKQVSQDNKEFQQRMEDESLAKSRKSSLTLGILGIVFCMVPIVALIFGGVGLLCAPKPSKTGGKACAGFILCLIALILGIVVPAGEIIWLNNL